MMGPMHFVLYQVSISSGMYSILGMDIPLKPHYSMQQFRMIRPKGFCFGCYFRPSLPVGIIRKSRVVRTQLGSILESLDGERIQVRHPPREPWNHIGYNLTLKDNDNIGIPLDLFKASEILITETFLVFIAKSCCKVLRSSGQSTLTSTVNSYSHSKFLLGRDSIRRSEILCFLKISKASLRAPVLSSMVKLMLQLIMQTSCKLTQQAVPAWIAKR